VRPNKRKNIYTGKERLKNDRDQTINAMNANIKTYTLIMCVLRGIFLSRIITMERPRTVSRRLMMIKSSSQKNQNNVDPMTSKPSTMPAINVWVRKRINTFGFLG